MGFMDNLFGKKSEEAPTDDISIDELGNEEEDIFHENADVWVKPVTLMSLEDVRMVKDHIYKGNIVLLDVEPLAKRDTVRFRQAASELKSAVTKIDGDIVKISEYKLLVTPKGTKVSKSGK